MNTFEHLSKILPSNGLKIMAVMVQRTDSDGNPIFKPDGKPSITTKHKIFGSIEQLAKAINSTRKVVDHYIWRLVDMIVNVVLSTKNMKVANTRLFSQC